MFSRFWHLVYLVFLLPVSVVSGITNLYAIALSNFEWVRKCQDGVECSLYLKWTAFLVNHLPDLQTTFFAALTLTLISWTFLHVLKFRRCKGALKNSFYAARTFDGLYEANRKVSHMLISKTRLTPEGRATISKYCYEKIEAVLDEISKFYENYTGRKCHVSIKHFVINNGSRTRELCTYARDKRYRETQRRDTDRGVPPFDYSKNTAYKEILDDPKRRFYFNNWLIWTRRYENTNKKWRKYYTATLVIPLTDKNDADEVTHSSVIGFLCIDNKGGGFDSRIAAYSGRFVARLLYPVMISIGKIVFADPVEK